MYPKMKIAFLLVAIATLVFPVSALADGIIIPDPPICDPIPCPGPFPLTQLDIKYHHVTVTIADQLAITHVDQVFYNPNDWQIEGTYIFPIPLDAVVTNFTLWIDGQPVEGQVLSAEEARRTYEEIVRQMVDPALLEYAGRGAVRASIFPIPPRSERRIELEYTQALTAENGLVRYVYPLNTEKFSLNPLESVSVSVDIRSSTSPIRAVYSPSHNVGVSRDSDFHVTAGYEDANVIPNTDFSLYYSLGENEAFHLLTFRDPGDSADPDGFFLLLLAPSPDAAEVTVPKDVFIILDRSGSMEGEKFVQAQEALRYILRHLNPADRFNIIAFSTGLEKYANSLRDADEANEAIAWVDMLSARGSTDINLALLEAAAMTESQRPTYVIFLTDGLPTEGEIDSDKIIGNLASAAPDNLRLFAFGVGYDVDTFLLDSLAQEHHGASTYVAPSTPLDEVVSAFYAKISTPVLTDLTLDFGGLSVYDIYPLPLPDLFVGSQIVVVGRYHQGGAATVTLTGKVNESQQTFRYPEQVFTADTQAQAGDPLTSIPRLWATRKIGYLLNQIRLSGPDEETINQIVKLSIRYGIVTPYTSYLVTEDMPLGVTEQERIAGEEYNRIMEAPAASVSGEDAVEKAANEGFMLGAGAPSAPPVEYTNLIKIVGSRTFVYSNEVWVDTAFDPATMQTVKVSFLSDDYFALSAARPELAGAFALGERVIVLSDGVAYEIVGAEEATSPVVIPPTVTPAPIQPVYPVFTPEPTTSSTPAGSTLPCGSSLIPLALLPLLVWSSRRRKA